MSTVHSILVQKQPSIARRYYAYTITSHIILDEGVTVGKMTVPWWFSAQVLGACGIAPSYACFRQNPLMPASESSRRMVRSFCYRSSV